MMKGPTGANGLAPVSMDSWYTLEMKRAPCSHLPRPQPSELAQGRAHSELVVFCYQLSEPQPCSLVHTHVRQGGDSGRKYVKGRVPTNCPGALHCFLIQLAHQHTSGPCLSHRAAEETCVTDQSYFLRCVYME